MPFKSFGVLTATAILFAVGFGPLVARNAQASECDASQKIDSSTANTARAKMKKAGFRQIHDLKKGCDSFWHAQATKDDAAVNIVLSPQGHVMTEGD
ncbi:MAG TPA: hypothetical protein VN809_12315 [Telmatospirillum sp.]|nr:hypothetical protein [Telmatospirillum sp.]